MAGLVYVHSTALVKLVLPEPESEALAAYLAQFDCVSSEIAWAEVRRATRRATQDAACHDRAEAVLESLHALKLTPEILTEAGTAPPVALRTVDAIHLASAAALADELEALVSYDPALLRAARLVDLETAAPVPIADESEEPAPSAP